MPMSLQEILQLSPIEHQDRLIIRHNKIVGDILLGFMFIILLLFVAMVVNFVYPYKTVELLEPIEIHTPVYAGEPLIYTLHLKKHVNLPARITRNLLNERVVTYTPYANNLAPGEHKKSFSLNVPETATPGPHKLALTFEYDINFMRTVTVKYESAVFDIKPSRIHSIEMIYQLLREHNIMTHSERK
jgi:hypothetical protein